MEKVHLPTLIFSFIKKYQTAEFAEKRREKKEIEQ